MLALVLTICLFEKKVTRECYQVERVVLDPFSPKRNDYIEDRERTD